MKIVLLGGGGFIGSAISDRLLRDGHALRVFERPRVIPHRKYGSSETLEWVTGDLQSIHDITAAIEGMDAVIHLASTTLPKNSNEDPIFDVQSNLVATLQLMNAMVVSGLKKIIFVSSGGTVYGEPEYLPIDEKHPTNPIVSYGIVKLAIEKYLRLFQRMYGIRTVILRLANPFGERQRAETAQGAIAVFLHNILRGKEVEIWGTGNATRDYLYIGDVAEAFSKALVYEGSFDTFNISSGIGVSLNDLLSVLQQEVGHEIIKRYLPGRPFDVPVSILCNKLAEKELKWTPRTQLKEGIGLTAAWIRKNLD